jgi:hypothetical protein
MKKKTGASGRRVNAAAIARECGLSRQRVSVLLGEGYTPAAILRRQKQKHAARLDDGSHSGPSRAGRESLLRAKTRKESALATLRELDLRAKQGELIERAQVEAEFAQAIVGCRDRFLRLPAELRERCDQQPGAVIEKLYDGEIRRTLTDFARHLRMGETEIERGRALWTEFLKWTREKKGERRR